MIRYRMAQVDSAADRAIEWLRAPKPMEEVAPAILAVLAQAAGSVRAAYWVFDAVGERLRPFVTWSPSGTEAPTPGQEAPLLALGFRNAAIAWCGGKPVWSTMPIPESLSSPQDSTSPGLHGGVWFALKTDIAVYGVIELLGRAFEPRPPETLSDLGRIGFRLGRGVHRSLREEAVRLNL